MNFLKLLKTAIERTRERWRGRIVENFLLIFNWHQITPVFDACCHHKYTWTQFNNFEEEVKFLMTELQILPLNEAISRLKSRSLRGPCASLTFDDGDASMATHVWPLLRKWNLPATFFINSAYLDNHCSYWFPILTYLSVNEDARRKAEFPVVLQEKGMRLRSTQDWSFYNEVRSRIEEFGRFVPNLSTRLVSSEWLSSLDGDQFSIGAHGHEHQRFSMMPTVWQRNDLRENVRILSQFKAFRPVFAVPFGRTWDWTKKTIRIAHEQSLSVVLADGGINFGCGDFYRRNPSDGKKILPLVVTAMSRR
jgi:peptidoglycan/xylan/chitin deacetylase (PgdA/CDA1 family)